MGWRCSNRHIIKPHKSVYVFLIFLYNLIDICYTNHNTTVELKVVNHSTSFLVDSSVNGVDGRNSEGISGDSLTTRKLGYGSIFLAGVKKFQD